MLFSKQCKSKINTIENLKCLNKKKRLKALFEKFKMKIIPFCDECLP